MGVAAVEKKGKGGRHRGEMTLKERTKTLEDFRAVAATGELVTRDNKAKNMKWVGRKKVAEDDESTRILKKHKWATKGTLVTGSQSKYAKTEGFEGQNFQNGTGAGKKKGGGKQKDPEG